MKIGSKGIDLIKEFEGCKLKAYYCPAKVVTIGYGNTFYYSGARVKIGDTITQDEAEELLHRLVTRYERTVDKSITRDLTQNQYDALVSFCWNCGSSKTLFRMINGDYTDMEICEWWETHYITGNGKVLKGLIRRRKAEAALFMQK